MNSFGSGSSAVEAAQTLDDSIDKQHMGLVRSVKNKSTSFLLSCYYISVVDMACMYEAHIAILGREPFNGEPS